MRLFGKFVKWTSLLLCSLLFVVLLSALLVLRWPQNVIRSQWIESYLKEQSFVEGTKWEKFDLQISSNSFLKYQIKFLLKDFSHEGQYGSSQEELTAWGVSLSGSELLAQLEVAVLWTWGIPEFKIRALEETRLVLGQVTVNETLPKNNIEEKKSSEKTSSEKTSTLFWKQELWKYLELYDFRPQVSVDRIDYSRDSQKWVTLSALNLGTNSISSEEDLLMQLSTKILVFVPSERLGPIDLKSELRRNEFILNVGVNELKQVSEALDVKSFETQCRFKVAKLDEIFMHSQTSFECEAYFDFVNRWIVGSSKLKAKSNVDFMLSPDLGAAILKDFKWRWTLNGLGADWLTEFDYEAPLDVLNKEASVLVEELLESSVENLKTEIRVVDVHRFLKTINLPYQELPAPLNHMRGGFQLTQTNKIQEKAYVSFADFRLMLEDEKQKLNLELAMEWPWNWKDSGSIDLGTPQMRADLKELNLLLPNFGIRQPLPNLMADARFKKEEKSSGSKAEPIKKTKQQEQELNWNLDLKTEEPIALKTSLLENEIKIHSNLNVSERGIEKGQVELLPLHFEVFRRPIEVKEMKLSWPLPLWAEVHGEILFRLPEYLITLKIEGPVGSPRTAFASDPPLSSDDIYAVLLFGRPVSELDPEGRQGMARVQHGLSQGLFSLSMLYLLGGSRIESVMYDPTSNEVSASVRLDSRHSVRLGTSETGGESVALRRSLGGGWFIESRAQQTTSQRAETSTNDFGLMLQRIIAY